MPTETGNGWYFFETNESVGTIPAWSFGVYIYNSNDGAIFGITADNSLFSAFKIKGNWAPINSIELFKPASGSIKYGMNGIYIGKFENGALIPTETNVFENCIYLIGNGGDQTAVYAFTIGQYSSGHLFFNRMTYDNIWQLDEWKKLI